MRALVWLTLASGLWAGSLVKAEPSAQSDAALKTKCVQEQIMRLLPDNYADLKVNSEDIYTSKWTYVGLNLFQGVKWFGFKAIGSQGSSYDGLIRIIDFQRELSPDNQSVVAYRCRPAISLTWDDPYFLLYDSSGQTIVRQASKIIMPMDE